MNDCSRCASAISTAAFNLPPSNSGIVTEGPIDQPIDEWCARSQLGARGAERTDEGHARVARGLCHAHARRALGVAPFGGAHVRAREQHVGGHARRDGRGGTGTS
ncbi:hypothetical protein [Paraburkholderia sp. A3RO-2L]|uniref:hypothetical protein n=1 Tax=Paraburkholderia sp. A3RO-2L TaxID=3028376 RepID=UPI003DA8BB12